MRYVVSRARATGGAVANKSWANEKLRGPFTSPYAPPQPPPGHLPPGPPRHPVVSRIMTDVLVNRFARAAPGLNVPRKKESSARYGHLCRARIAAAAAAAAASEIVKNGYGVAVAGEIPATATRKAYGDLQLRLSAFADLLVELRERERG